MDEENTQQDQDRSKTTGKSLKETFQSGTPDDVRDRVKDATQKAVAAVAGALKGFADEAERSDVAGTSKNAVHQAGETVRSTASSVTEEAKGLKAPLQEAGQKLRETAHDITSTARDELGQAKDALRGERSGEAQGAADRGGARGLTGQGTEMPDLSRTPMAEPDRKLQGKDLLHELDEDPEP